LFRFDIVPALPPEATIESATLTLVVTRQPNAGYVPGIFDLYRVLRPWGEGNQTAPEGHSPGLGGPARKDEATWNDRFALTTQRWARPGGEATNDYLATPSASQVIYDVGNSPYTFGPTLEMAADVQLWLRHPETNYGWILICEGESTPFTARRFGSREDTNNAPQLDIEYLLPPRIAQTQAEGGSFKFQFTAEPEQAYTVQYSDSLAPSRWVNLTNIAPASQPVIHIVETPLTGRQRFYRLDTQ
jgi:hypothetical protein